MNFKDIKINKQYLKSLNPCADRWQNYLINYAGFDGSIVEFLELENITWKDKKWVLFRKNSLLPKNIMREFSLLCACRAVDSANIKELSEYFNLVLLMFESGEDLCGCAEYLAADRSAYLAADRSAYLAADRSAYSAAYWAAYWAADWAAYSAADWTAEENIQKEILINLCEEYLQ